VKKPKQTRREKFLGEMEAVVPWGGLLWVIAPYYPKAGNGRRPYELSAMLRIHFMQQWFALSDPRMEDALHDVPVMREFAGLGGRNDRLPDETTILRFRHLLDRHHLAEGVLGTVNHALSHKGLVLRAGTVVDAALVSVPGAPKNPGTAPGSVRHRPKKSGLGRIDQCCMAGLQVGWASLCRPGVKKRTVLRGLLALLGPNETCLTFVGMN
jgi:IS5 family transposase